jgi:hypothetical protein
VNLGDAFMVQGRLNGTISTADFEAAVVDPEGPTGSTNELIVDQSFSEWSLGVIYSVEENVQLDVSYGQLFGGRNTLAGSKFSVGLAWKQ